MDILRYSLSHFFFSVALILSILTPQTSSRFSINSEAFASEFKENIKEMFPRYFKTSNHVMVCLLLIVKELTLCYAEF